jgi:hypothetical protein
MLETPRHMTLSQVEYDAGAGYFVDGRVDPGAA